MVTLAQFVANYSVRSDGSYEKRKKPRIIRYRNYDMGQDLNDYKRKMISLHYPFRNEEAEILADFKFVAIYDENENSILNRRNEFESNLDNQKTITICRDLCRIDRNHDVEIEDQAVAKRFSDDDPFQQLFTNLNAWKKLGAVEKRRENLHT